VNYPTNINVDTSNMSTTGEASTSTTLPLTLNGPFKVYVSNAQDSLVNEIHTMASYLINHDLDMSLIVSNG